MQNIIKQYGKSLPFVEEGRRFSFYTKNQQILAPKKRKWGFGPLDLPMETNYRFASNLVRLKNKFVKTILKSTVISFKMNNCLILLLINIALYDREAFVSCLPKCPEDNSTVCFSSSICCLHKVINDSDCFHVSALTLSNSFFLSRCLPS